MAGSAVAWPLVAQAQQTGKLAKVGYLGPSSLALERVQVDALKQRLHELGYVEGKDIAYVFRWAEGHDERFPALAVELAGLKPDVIVTTGTPGTLAAKRATSTIPIIFASSANPISSGLVSTYSRPGGNVTGFTILGPELEGKRVQLLKEAVPALSRIAVMWNPANPAIVDFLHQMRAAASALNISVKPIAEVTQASELKTAFSLIADSQPQAMLVIADRSLLAKRADIVSFAATQRLPTMYPYRGYVDAGGLGDQPMDMAFRGDELFVACQGDGSVHVVEIPGRRIKHHFKAGKGCESLGFF
jgi:putative tryptophan/tyrosine transport system substrate-binding protein